MNTTAYHPQADELAENFNRTLHVIFVNYAAKFGMNLDEHLLFLYISKYVNPINPVSLYVSCYMAIMLGFPVRSHYPQHTLRIRDQEQRTAPRHARRSEVGVVPEVTWNMGGALRSLRHVGGAQFPQAARDRSAINGERAEA